MFKAIANLFGKRDRLRKLSQCHDRRSFIRALGESDIFICAALTTEGLDPSAVTPEQLLAEVERAAHESSESDGFHPFVYVIGGKRRLPFFSGEDHAQTFCGQYSKERNRILPFLTLGVKGATLAHVIQCCDECVMNDKSDAPHVLSQEDVRLLLEMWT